uniref:NADH-ubiquinone oxidoreductase chain 5 n=1 Tax=Chouioia cunea TaxID=1570515 RepID=A0A8B0R5C4_9HYME|nr:NADH dehydrogenase subunit 5 [Chouioia cunea]QTW90617.1 NADH dehydrogenase subunit 5 [Chouioia cunea]
MYLSMSIFLFLYSMMFFFMKLNLFIEWNSMMLNSISFNMYIYIDWMSLMFIFLICIISSMIMFYSKEYMNHDNNNIQFFWILFFFIKSMILMILSPNLLTILIGWDGLGLTSYCLIIFYQNKSSYNCGMITVMINRIGDILFIMSISLMMMIGSFSFMNYNSLNWMIMMMVIISAFTKSAQFPFSSWLPAAMAAPTPVSSLVHSSTLVTAGIYMLIRFNNILIINKYFMLYMMITGLITMFMAGMSANFEFDLKKIIAYSTLSQLGLMMMILSMGMIQLTFFHLVIHALFKSMMFMCSGVMIHCLINYQDIRYMGYLKHYMPMTMLMFFISNLSLCGLPFMSGYFSKDFFLEKFMMMENNLMLYFLLMMSTMLTVMYSFRLIYYLLNSNFNFVPMNLIKETKLMNYSMIILMICSIMFGMLLNWILFNSLENIFLMKWEKMLIMIICIMGYIMSYYLIKLIYLINYYYFLKYFLGKMWFLYKFNFLKYFYIMKLGKFYYLIFDKIWSEEITKKFMMYNNNKLNLMNLMNKNYLTNLFMFMNFIGLIYFMMN